MMVGGEIQAIQCHGMVSYDVTHRETRAGRASKDGGTTPRNALLLTSLQGMHGRGIEACMCIASHRMAPIRQVGTGRMFEERGKRRGAMRGERHSSQHSMRNSQMDRGTSTER